MTMEQHVKRFVALKRHLGRKFDTNKWVLMSWARHAMSRDEEIIRTESALQWASAASTPRGGQQRLYLFRPFAVWMHAEDDRHEIPPPHMLGKLQWKRRSPYLLSDAQIRQLMDAALCLPPPGSMTPHTVHCAIGLVAATGLRNSEICSLSINDITRDGLIIRNTKFGKSRMVPLHPSVEKALVDYLGVRKRTAASCDRLFVLSRGKPVKPSNLSGLFRKLARTVGLRDKTGTTGVRLHDLRHRFAVRSLENLQSDDPADISRHILALSTWLGHSCLDSTMWYLEATPKLLSQIARQTEQFHGRGEVQ